MAKGRKRRIGDRREGRRIRTIDPFNAMIPFLMKQKSEASNYFSASLEVTEIERYLRKKRIAGHPGIGMLHLFIAAYIRTASQYPALNRFCSGQRIFAREKVDFLMMLKKQMRTDAGETSIKIPFDRDATINDVYDKLNAEINKVKNEGETTNSDRMTAAFMKLPRLILRFTVAFLVFLDYFDLLPQKIIDASPFHGSVFITDMGSIGLSSIYHHLFNIGNLPMFIAIGAKKKVYELNSKGEVVTRKYIDFKFVVDERICDGFYFSQAFKVYRSLLQNPEALEEPPEQIVEDIE